MIEVYSVFDYISKVPGALGALVLVVAGSSAWLFQRYASFLVQTYSRRARETELASAVRSEIEILIKYYEQEFTNDALKKTFATIESMHTKPPSIEPRPLVTAAARDTIVFDNIKSDLTQLPRGTISSVVKFYTLNAVFDSSYNNQGTELFRELNEATKKDVVNEVYECAKECIVSGREAVEKIQYATDLNSQWNVLVFVINALVIIGLFGSIARHLSFS